MPADGRWDLNRP